MNFDRFLGALDRLAYRIAGPTAEDRAAGFELAVASRRFSRRAKAVVDDKLNFSATLMRAGEVEAANRLLAEVEREVRTEEAALIEVVNEVKIEREMNRAPVTRVALARMMAAAMIGSTLLATSAVGMAVAGLFKNEDTPQAQSRRDDATTDSRDRVMGLRLASATQPVRVAGVKMNFTAAELDRFRELTRGEFDGERLETFLLGFLPPALAEQVQLALSAASDALPAGVEEPLIVVSERANTKRKEAAAEEPTEEKADETPSPEPSGPEPSEEGKSDDADEDEDDDSNGLPIIGDDGNDG
ncbi:MAG TPA: hypothetical protein VG408_01450 [Actinomycetota bacterium]|nr:hypothetical protein [Actinomycetota bacterium]